MTETNFSSLALTQEMLTNLDKIGYTQMTPIQAESLPHILQNKDVLAQAKTGSGKTAAFGIGLLSNLDVKKFRIQSLILCPTRELAEQVSKELRVLAKFAHNIKILTLIGGESFGKQLGSLRHNAHIVVGTPGRVLKHLNKESFDASNLNTLVLDEADRMLDMGFFEEIENILSHIPKEKQTLLFSATYPQEILSLSKKLQNDAVMVKTTEQEVKNEIEQKFFFSEDKLQTIIALLSQYNPKNVILFCNMKVECDSVAQALQKKDIDALALHGDMEQYERNDVLVQFANESARVLVATDVAARGLDIKELEMVVNYDLANTKEIYTHRIGRTARAGAKGIALTLHDDRDEQKLEDYQEESDIEFLNSSILTLKESFKMPPKYMTLVIEGGKKDKLRAGDIVGALTSTKTINFDEIGKIDIYDRQAYVAIAKDVVKKAQQKLSKDKIKSKNFSVWILD
jgi:ATP-independent RNA helicase DbpA